jgi:hypothetical protein
VIVLLNVDGCPKGWLSDKKAALRVAFFCAVFLSSSLKHKIKKLIGG